jgi:hypothetical protein
VTAVSIKDSMGRCEGVALNTCANAGTPNLLRVFAWTEDRPADVCNRAPALQHRSRQGYRTAHVWGESLTDLGGASGPMPAGDKGDYCAGTVTRSQVIGKSVDKTKGSSNWDEPVVPGKPWPCTIINSYHLNLGPGASGGVNNSCPSNYTSHFEKMSGTSFFSCSHSDSHVGCRNKDEDTGRDMDTILFRCEFNR